MTNCNVIYDMTRLATRVVNDVPNGIDRVDLALAKYFLSRPDDAVEGLICTISGPSLVPASVARAVVTEVESRWHEIDHGQGDLFYEKILERLITPSMVKGRIVRRSEHRFGAAAQAVWKYGLRFGRSPRKAAPHGAAYINASHFPLEHRWYSTWLLDRPDIVPAFFIHDLLPIESPQLFWRSEPSRHRQRLENIRRVGGRAIVSSSSVAGRVAGYFHEKGYAIPICQMPPPISSIFYTSPSPDARLMERPFFIVCGTIEPRKNHALLLQVWRELAKQQGARTPTLLIVGKRGWNSEGVVALLERSRAATEHVIEIAGLPTPALKRLMDNAKALLAPSFSEGFGLPVAEAMAAGLPVIASDIDTFRQISNEDACLISPLDGLGWLKAVTRTATEPRRMLKRPPENANAFSSTLEPFLLREETAPSPHAAKPH